MGGGFAHADMADEEDRGFAEMLTLADKGGRGALDPPPSNGGPILG